MIKVYIDGVDRTSDVELNSVSIKGELSNRSGSADFTVMSGEKPSENQEVIIYKCDTIASYSSGTKTITLTGNFERGVRFFAENERMTSNIGVFSTLSGQRFTQECEFLIDSYDETNLTITVPVTLRVSPVSGNLVGVRIFGGIISRVTSRNTGYESNVEYNIEAGSYKKIFDKKYISDSWENVSPRTIVNDMLNNDINYNVSIDSMDYASDAACAAEWIDSSDGDNPTIDILDFIQGSGAVKFNYTFATGTARFTASPSPIDVSSIVKSVSTGPTEGFLTFWAKIPSSFLNTSSQTSVEIGSSAGRSHTYPLREYLVCDDEWHFYKIRMDAFNGFSTASGLSTDWTAIAYIRFNFFQITASGSIKIDDIRIVGQNSFFPAEIVTTPTIDSFISPRIKPSEILSILAERASCIAYIDSFRNIRIALQTAVPAPFQVTDSTRNFTRLQVDVDQSQLGNRILILGGEDYSDSRYPQIEVGDNAKREWVIKSKFADMEVLLDDASDTHSAESGTTTTNIKVTGHGLSTGDHITNRTRDNAVREITVVDANNFTVAAVPSQTTGDTITFFTVSKTVGYEGLDDADEASFDFMANSNARTMRNSSHITTFSSSILMKFTFIERVPIQVLYTDYGSVAALKALGLGDGIFDLDTISDSSIEDRATALAIAQAKVAIYSNAIITGSFTTDKHGLEPWQLLTVGDSNQGVSGDYIVQSVSMRQAGGDFKDYFVFNIKFGTSLNGWIEFMQKLLSAGGKIQINDESIVATFIEANEVITSDDANTLADGVGFLLASEAETMTSDDVNTVDDTTSGAWQYETSTGQVFTTRFDLCDYGP